jgi:hypothetical protein
MKFLFLVASFLFFICAACKKNKQQAPAGEQHSLGHPITCPATPAPIVNQNMVACKFKPGTFWVFKDSVTNNIDTLLVQDLAQSDHSRQFDANGGPCYVETFYAKAIFKNDTGNVLISMDYILQERGFVLLSKFFWTSGGQQFPYVYTDYPIFNLDNSKDTISFKIRDSLFIGDRYYKKVGESYAVQFVSENPNRMYCQSLKTYFNPEFGFLQFDLRDRLTGQLTGRRKIIARNIVR